MCAVPSCGPVISRAIVSVFAQLARSTTQLLRATDIPTAHMDTGYCKDISKARSTKRGVAWHHSCVARSVTVGALCSEAC